MNVEGYKEYIEKTAGLKDKAISAVSKHKKLLIGAGATSAGLGGLYLASPKEGKKKIKDGVKTVGNSVVTARLNGEAQDAVKNIGGLIGTGLALKKGKSLGKAVASGGLAGMAIGDIAGATTIPTYQLYKKHKKEFGEAPDAKSLAAVLGANVAPTAALWGGIYGLKSGANKLRQGTARIGSTGKVGDFIRRGGNAVTRTTDNLSSGIEDIVSSVGKMKNDYRTFVPKKPKELNVLKAKHKKGMLTPDEIKRYNSLASEYNAKSEAASKLFNQMGEKGIKDAMSQNTKSMFGGAKKMTKAFVPLGLAAELAAAPTYVVTPQNVINTKKRKLEKAQEE